ncbi:hypothetical protein [Streptomyces sp. cmx-18-6]|uniref:hypothetical protein n=1 Tax=Streptomyces sp. cmx-18-6 TaxID=2790930 RepID=UPI00397ED9D1
MNSTETRRPTPPGAKKAERRGSLWGTRPVLVSMAVVLLLAVSAVEIAGFAEMTEESPRRPLGPGASALMLPFLFCFGLPVALIGSVLAVLPTLTAARWAGIRFGGRHAWWWIVPAAACWAAVAALWPAVVDGDAVTWLWVWPAATAVLSAVSLPTRWALTRRRPYWSVIGAGGLSAVAVFVAGSLAYGTGLVDAYAPPRVDASALTGTWSDGRGGTVRLAPDGRVSAVGTRSEHAGRLDEEPCEGPGTWKFEPHDDPWRQRLVIDVGDCWGWHWTLGGSADRPKLNYEYGDPDSPDWYVLTRPGGQAHR